MRGKKRAYFLFSQSGGVREALGDDFTVIMLTANAVCTYDGM